MDDNYFTTRYNRTLADSCQHVFFRFGTCATLIFSPSADEDGETEERG